MNAYLTVNGFPFRDDLWFPPTDLLHPPFHMPHSMWRQWRLYAFSLGETEADDYFGRVKQRCTSWAQHALMQLVLWTLLLAVTKFHVLGTVSALVLGLAACVALRLLVWWVVWAISRIVLARWSDPRILDLSTQAYVHQMGELWALVHSQGQLLHTAPTRMRLCESAADLQVPYWVVAGPDADDAATGSFVYERRIFHEWGVTMEDVQAWASFRTLTVPLMILATASSVVLAWVICYVFGFTKVWQVIVAALLFFQGMRLLYWSASRRFVRSRIDQMPPHSAYKHIEQAKLNTRS